MDELEPRVATVIAIQDRSSVLARREIAAALDTMSVDELRLMAELVRKYLEGRAKYGALVLAKDSRDFMAEARAEGKDLIFYLVCDWLKNG